MIWVYILSFVLGTAFGSFLNVVVHRFGEKKSMRGRSACVSCKVTILGRDLVPIVSYILIGGKCRSCRKPISLRYPIIELVLGVLFLFVTYFHYHTGDPQGPSFIVRDWYIIWVLSFIFLFDIWYMSVDDRIVIPAVMTVYIVSGMLGWQTWSNMALGGAVAGGFFLAQYLISKGRWIGSGDILVGLCMGVILGWPMTLIALFVSYVAGALVSLFLLATKKKTRKDRLPFAAYLALGTFVVMFWGTELLSWYTGLMG